ncbi:hypothetical protein GCM10022212_12340 [Actimicrobium antarcticum]|uniref:Uncharacterized protein n=1 Tax=Actimicrobium antarcticum TaxID=1051899 RepID=A0ABP7SY63_9BURK
MPCAVLHNAMQTGVLDGMMPWYETVLGMGLYLQVWYGTPGGDDVAGLFDNRQTDRRTGGMISSLFAPFL